ncbi:metal ABC transporter substrate-binding protein [Bengtsoniella intestinalis]|uniref:metal ABC transporter substrate-binding protein n=1 Tax=Bengtsoniella intestinalis TaxID=3073143 RepID=UPI00391F3FBB
MKQIFAMLTAFCVLFTAGCSSAETEVASEETSYHVVTTNFALYDWTKTLLGDTDGVALTYLLDTGTDSHSYQPTADDIVTIADCDLFIYVGGESDAWVEGVLAQSVNDDMLVLNLMEALGDRVLAEELVEGMESDHDHDHEETEADHDHEDEETEADHDHEDEETEADEHIWLSLRNAQVLTGAIAEQLTMMNPDNSGVYATNLEGYGAALADLDAQYSAVVEEATSNVIVVADRFPFLYLVTDYGIEYYAAFSGCSAETEASFETIVFLAEQVDALGVETILTIENPQHEIAQTVSATTQMANQTILAMDSMQSTTAQDVENGDTYLDIMVENLAVLATALG